MQEVPSVLAEAAMTKLFLHSLEPEVCAAVFLRQLCGALHLPIEPTPEESLAMAHSGRGLVPAGAPDEVRGDVGQEASLRGDQAAKNHLSRAR